MSNSTSSRILVYVICIAYNESSGVTGINGWIKIGHKGETMWKELNENFSRRPTAKSTMPLELLQWQRISVVWFRNGQCIFRWRGRAKARKRAVKWVEWVDDVVESKIASHEANVESYLSVTRTERKCS